MNSPRTRRLVVFLAVLAAIALAAWFVGPSLWRALLRMHGVHVD